MCLHWIDLFFLFLESCLYSQLRKRVDKVLFGVAGYHLMTPTTLGPFWALIQMDHRMLSFIDWPRRWILDLSSRDQCDQPDEERWLRQPELRVVRWYRHLDGWTRQNPLSSFLGSLTTQFLYYMQIMNPQGYSVSSNIWRNMQGRNIIRGWQAENSWALLVSVVL